MRRISAVIQDFFQFVQNVFNELDAQYNEGGERAVNKRLADKSIAGPVVLGGCRQHPTATIYEEALGAYRGMRGLAVPLASDRQAAAAKCRQSPVSEAVICHTHLAISKRTWRFFFRRTLPSFL